ncbi:MAG: OmpA family protein [Alphaproteobacteria bacterium]|nr:OmpA family protein [Alphaproteobacteria bacterium]
MAILAVRRRGSRTAVSHGGSWRRRAIALLVAAVLTILAAPHASAQKAPSRSSVEVDLGALDSLGPAPAESGGKAIRLHPPAAAESAPRPASAAAKPRPPTQSASAAPAEIPVPDASRIPPAPSLPPVPPPPSAAAAKPPQTAPASEAAPPAAAPQKTASLPPNPAPTNAGKVEDRLLFAGADTELPSTAKTELDQLAKRLTANSRLVVQLVAYAGGGGDASQARRLSLARALAARSYLVDQGVDVKQVDIRPLGNRTEPGLPADRVDLVVAEH